MMTREELILKYDLLISKCSRFERKGKTNPYTSANGHMFSTINKTGELGIRFSKEIQQKYLEELNTTLFKSYGAVMQGYILIPEPLLENEKEMIRLLNESYDYALSLPTK